MKNKIKSSVSIQGEILYGIEITIKYRNETNLFMNFDYAKYFLLITIFYVFVDRLAQ